MGEDGFAVGHEGGAVFADGLADSDVFVFDAAGLGDQGGDYLGAGLAGEGGVEPAHALDAPEQVNGRWAGGGQGGADEIEFVFAPLDADGDAHGGGDADGGGAADDHRLNRVGHLGVAAAGDKDRFARQAGLVDHDHPFRCPFNCFDHSG